MKNRFKKILVMFMIMTLSIGLIGCGSKENQEQNQEKVTNVADESVTQEATNREESGSDTAESVIGSEVAYPVTFADSFGTEITLAEEPTKVISIAPNLTELMYALNAQDKLIGRSEYCDYPEEVSSIETVGTLYTPDIEKIVSLEPDLVLTSTHFSDEDAAKLTELGIPVVSLYEESDVYGVLDMIRTLGVAVNHQEDAAQVVDSMQSVFDEVTEKIKELDMPTVYYVVGYGEYGDYTAGGDTFIGNILAMAGGDNIAKDVSGWSYSLESLVEADPDIIVVRTGDKEGFVQAEGYKDLTAVKEDHVYEMDTNTLDRQGYRNADGLLTLAEIFHPEAFTK